MLAGAEPATMLQNTQSLIVPDRYILQELQSLELQPEQEFPAREVGIPPSLIVKQANRESIRSDGF
jgi:hypothetical protein